MWVWLLIVYVLSTSSRVCSMESMQDSCGDVNAIMVQVMTLLQKNPINEMYVLKEIDRLREIKESIMIAEVPLLETAIKVQSVAIIKALLEIFPLFQEHCLIRYLNLSAEIGNYTIANIFLDAWSSCYGISAFLGVELEDIIQHQVLVRLVLQSGISFSLTEIRGSDPEKQQREGQLRAMLMALLFDGVSMELVSPVVAGRIPLFWYAIIEDKMQLSPNKRKRDEEKDLREALAFAFAQCKVGAFHALLAYIEHPVLITDNKNIRLREVVEALLFSSSRVRSAHEIKTYFPLWEQLARSIGKRTLGWFFLLLGKVESMFNNKIPLDMKRLIIAHVVGSRLWNLSSSYKLITDD